MRRRTSKFGLTCIFGVLFSCLASGQGSRRPILPLGVHGAAGDGSTDDSVALKSACTPGAEIWLSAAKYRIGSSLTLACNLRFIGGAQLLVPDGVTVTLSGSVDAFPAPIFRITGSGSVQFAVPVDTVPVEWFGAIADATTDDTAAIQAAIDSIRKAGAVKLQCGTYRTTRALTIQRSSVSIYGGPCQGLAGNQSTILSGSASADILDVHSSSGLIQWNQIRNLALRRTSVPMGTARGLSVDNVGGYDVDHVTSQDSMVDFYFHAAPNYSVGSVRNIHAGWGVAGPLSGSYAPGSLYGVSLDSTDGVAENSILIENANVSNRQSAATTYGYYINGSAINDIDIRNAFTDATTYGAYINYTGGGGAFAAGDIVFENSTFDNFGVAGIYVGNIPYTALGAITFNGGYVLSLPGVGPSSCAVDIQNSSGVTLNDFQIGNGNGNGICLRSDSFVKITNNTIHGTGQTAIGATATTRSIVSLNTLEGAGVNGLSFDRASTANQVQGNAIDDAKTNPVNDLSHSGYNGLPVGLAPGTPSILASSTVVFPHARLAPAAAREPGGWAAATDRQFTLVIAPAKTTLATARSTLLLLQFGRTWTNPAGFPEIPFCTFSPRSLDAAGVRVFEDAGPQTFGLILASSRTFLAHHTYVWTVHCSGDPGN